MATEHRHTLVIALDVRDQDSYDRYRAGMRPILAEYGGRFDWDVRGGELLESPDAVRANRLFVLSFPDRKRSVAFFAEPRYQAVRTEFFEPAVSALYSITESD